MGVVMLTLWLALCVTAILLILGTPLAWWLSQTRSRAKPFIEALCAMPLILPPTVLGFYLLIAFNPQAPIGKFWVTVTGDTLSFSFAGLVIASVIYSLPFMVQPLQSAFEAVGQSQLEAAASLRASRWDSFRSVAVPQSRRGFLTARAPMSPRKKLRPFLDLAVQASLVFCGPFRDLIVLMTDV